MSRRAGEGGRGKATATNRTRLHGSRRGLAGYCATGMQVAAPGAPAYACAAIVPQLVDRPGSCSQRGPTSPPGEAPRDCAPLAIGSLAQAVEVVKEP